MSIPSIEQCVCNNYVSYGSRIDLHNSKNTYYMTAMMTNTEECMTCMSVRGYLDSNIPQHIVDGIINADSEQFLLTRMDDLTRRLVNWKHKGSTFMFSDADLWETQAKFLAENMETIMLVAECIETGKADVYMKRRVDKGFTTVRTNPWE